MDVKDRKKEVGFKLKRNISLKIDVLEVIFKTRMTTSIKAKL